MTVFAQQPVDARVFSKLRLAIMLFAMLAIQPLMRLRADEPQWIWNSPNAATQATAEPVVFRHPFTTQSPVKRLVITIACDNRYELYVDGVAVGRGEQWERPQQYQLTSLAESQNHLIAVRAKNDGTDPAGLAIAVRVETEGGVTEFVSDQSWNCAVESPQTANWWKRGEVNADAWQAASPLGVVGQAAPWGNRIAWSNPEVIEVTTHFRAPQETFEFLDGDRVTMIGGTWIERLQEDNYFETLVTTAYPDRDIRFRNLGWSGDEVTGIARAVFGSPQDGFARLRDDLLRTQPNVILIGYGGNEAFRGEAGLESFHREWLRLVELLESTGAALVFIAPPRHESLGAPLPDPTQINANIDLYAEAIQAAARERGHHFVDFRDPSLVVNEDDRRLPKVQFALTENGMHFTEFGHWCAAQKLARLLNVPAANWNLQIDLATKKTDGQGTRTETLETVDGRVRWVVQDERLPLPALPTTAPRNGEFLKPYDLLTVRGLPEGNWGLNIDGKPTLLASSEEWAAGVVIDRSRGSAIQELRSLIDRKNELYFHRYRPQNETYLFLFRKHEQGNNAIEIPQFDPLVEQDEEAIRALARPRSVAMELVPIADQ